MLLLGLARGPRDLEQVRLRGRLQALLLRQGVLMELAGGCSGLGRGRWSLLLQEEQVAHIRAVVQEEAVVVIVVVALLEVLGCMGPVVPCHPLVLVVEN